MPGRGWHSLRRKFATDLMHEPLKILCTLGGWKDAETVLVCYQRQDEATMRNALGRRPQGTVGWANRHNARGRRRNFNRDGGIRTRDPLNPIQVQS